MVGLDCVTKYRHEFVSGDVRCFKCCVISAPEGAFGRFHACVIYLGLGQGACQSITLCACNFDRSSSDRGDGP
jgi:hypothetical protein